MKMEINTRLVHRLSDGHFHSGEVLAKEFGISRAAVWKRIKSIESRLRLKVDAVPGRGYRFSSSLELLDADRINSCLSVRGHELVRELSIHQTIDSTNSWLMQQASLAAKSGTVCLAEQQLAGKGRHGRQWVSPFGSNVYLSLLWRFELTPVELMGMSLAAGIGVLRLLKNMNCADAGLKWPNDILWRGKKLAGLLLEVAGEADGPAHMVIGIGLNTQLGLHAEDIDQPWIDLASIPGVDDFSRNGLVASILESLLDVVTQYQITGLAGFVDEWNEYDLLKGSEVIVRSASQAYQGRHLGIDDTGAIKLQIDGEPRSFYAGEVSLRKS